MAAMRWPPPPVAADVEDGGGLGEARGEGGPAGGVEDDLADLVAEGFGFFFDDEAALVEDADEVGDGFDFVEKVRAEEDGGVAALEVGDDVAEEFFPHDGIEAEGGVVEDDEAGLVGEGQEEAEADVLAF